MATRSPQDRSAKNGAGDNNRYFFMLSLLCVAIGLLGFAPTYWLQLPVGTVDMPQIIHLHAIVFTAWLGLLVTQSGLAASGRLRHHRAWGMVGISLATLVFAVGMSAAIAMLKLHLVNGEGDAARSFHLAQVTSMVGFAVFFAAAIANARRPEWHKRFAIVATLILVAVGINRMFFLARNGMQPGLWPGALPSAPIVNSVRGLVVCVVILLIAMARDWRVEGRPHPAWMWGVGGLLVIVMIRISFSMTPAWLAFADWISRF